MDSSSAWPGPLPLALRCQDQGGRVSEGDSVVAGTAGEGHGRKAKPGLTDSVSRAPFSVTAPCHACRKWTQGRAGLKGPSNTI